MRIAVYPIHRAVPFLTEQYVKTVRDHIMKALRETVGPEVKERLSKYAKNWKHKPEFKVYWRRVGDDQVVYVKAIGENADIWNYVSRGTKPHVIRAKYAKALRFWWGGPGTYIPKTYPPRAIMPTTAQLTAAKELMLLKKVNHPGNKARLFEERVSADYKGRFRRVMKQALQEGMEAAWKYRYARSA